MNSYLKIYILFSSRTTDFEYPFDDAAPSPDYNPSPATPGYQPDTPSPAGPYTPQTPGSSYSPYAQGTPSPGYQGKTPLLTSLSYMGILMQFQHLCIVVWKIQGCYFLVISDNSEMIWKNPTTLRSLHRVAHTLTKRF